MAESNKENGKKNENGDGEKKFITAVLSVDLRCNCIGCIRRLRKACFSFHGVSAVKEDVNSNKVNVSGIFDPVKLNEMLQTSLTKKVELVSPAPPKKKSDSDSKSNADDQEKNKNSKHEKEPAVTTVVLKTSWHCEGCIHKIRKTVSAYKGVQRVEMDKAKELITVKGTAEPKLLVEHLKNRFKRPVQIVPEKKEKEEKNHNQQQLQQQNQEGGKKKGGGGGGGAEEGKADAAAQNKGATKVEYFMVGTGYGCREASSGYVVDVFYAPQMFSEDNPNSCSIM